VESKHVQARESIPPSSNGNSNEIQTATTLTAEEISQDRNRTRKAEKEARQTSGTEASVEDETAPPKKQPAPTLTAGGSTAQADKKAEKETRQTSENRKTKTGCAWKKVWRRRAWKHLKRIVDNAESNARQKISDITTKNEASLIEIDWLKKQLAKSQEAENSVCKKVEDMEQEIRRLRTAAQGPIQADERPEERTPTTAQHTKPHHAAPHHHQDDDNPSEPIDHEAAAVELLTAEKREEEARQKAHAANVRKKQKAQERQEKQKRDAAAEAAAQYVRELQQRLEYHKAAENEERKKVATEAAAELQRSAERAKATQEKQEQKKQRRAAAKESVERKSF
jgi:hypothetical protein